MSLTEKQLQIRKTGIGGSELGAIMGVSPFSGEYEVHDAKLGLAPPFVPNDAMSFGAIMEEFVAARYGHERGMGLVHASQYAEWEGWNSELSEHCGDGTLRSKQFPHLLVTPDFVGIGPEGHRELWEIKVVGKWSGSNLFSPMGTQPPRYPRQYELQLNAQGGVTGIHTLRLVVLVQSAKLPEGEVGWLRDTMDTHPRYVEWWCRRYAQTQELRSYVVPFSSEDFEATGAYVEDWWRRYVETGQKHPSWKPFKRPYNYSSTVGKKLKPAGVATWAGTW